MGESKLVKRVRPSEAAGVHEFVDDLLDLFDGSFNTSGEQVSAEGPEHRRIGDDDPAPVLVDEKKISV
jgi:hypothetical protein